MEGNSKNFRKRNAILQYLRNSEDHPSAEKIYTDLKKEIPDLSMGTVYRNLNLFKEQGLITAVATVNGVERYDPDTTPHVHFICTQCGDVQDLPEISVPEELNSAVAQSSGGRVDNCQLSFTGICGECRKLN
jgi:Fur family peroxide stress response transcriptional regulator